MACTKNFFIFFFLPFAFFFFPFFLFAQGGLVPCGFGGDMCDFNDLVKLVRAVISYALVLLVIFATAAIAFAGFLYLTSGEDSGKRTRAHGIFIKVAFGLAIALGAWVIVNAIAGTFLNETFLEGQFWFLKPDL